MITTYYTKKQVEVFLSHWGGEVPTKKADTVIAFPRTPDYQDEVARISYTTLKSDSGERLYKMRTGKASEVLA